MATAARQARGQFFDVFENCRIDGANQQQRTFFVVVELEPVVVNKLYLRTADFAEVSLDASFILRKSLISSILSKDISFSRVSWFRSSRDRTRLG